MPPSAAAAAAAAVPRYPAWVLLEMKGYDGDRNDATSARCKTITGRDVTVAFYLEPPPAVSYFCVHLSKFEGEVDFDFDFQPLFLFSAKGLVVFRFLFISRTDGGANLVQYFVYRAGRGHPSLEPIPSTPLGSRPDPICVSIVPCGDDDDYVLAELSVGSEIGHYDLHVYSCKTCRWNTTPLQLQLSSKMVCGNVDLPNQFHKVIGLGTDEVGWVDLWCGIVTCKVLDDDPVLRLIPLPKSEVDRPLELGPGLLRDVTYCNGVFKLIEMEQFCRPVIVVDETSAKISKAMRDFDKYGIIHDSELISPVVKQTEPIIVPDGWKIQSFFRFPSRTYWLRAHAVHADDISLYDSKHYMLPPYWADAFFAEKSALRNLITYYPTFGIHGDNVVYLIAKLKLEDDKTWVVGVDIEKKMLKLIQPYTAGKGGYDLPALLPSTFSYYLNTTPGCFPSTETNYSENALNNSTVSDLLPSDPLSCPGEATSAPSGTGNFDETIKPLSSDEYANIGQTIIVHMLRAILTSSGSESAEGYLHPTLKPVLNTNEDGKLMLSLPLGDHFSKPSGPELKLLNSLLTHQSELPDSLRLLLNSYSRPDQPLLARVLPPVTVITAGLPLGGQPSQLCTRR